MPTPRVSVIIPVYNDPRGVQLTLESVTSQTYPDDEHEIIVVNNNSDDRTQEFIDIYSEQYPERVRSVFEPKQGLPCALNAGVDAARGDILAFIDADMTVDVDWLESAVDTLEAGNHDYMGCHVEIYSPTGCETAATNVSKTFTLDIENYIEESNFTGSGCLVARRTVFETVGGYDENLKFGTDREFGKRVAAAGFDQHYAPSVTMYHPARATLAEQIEKAIRGGRANTLLSEIYPDLFDLDIPPGIRDFLPPHPQNYYAQVDDDVTAGMLLKMYGISYLSKLVRTGASLDEYVRQRLA